MWVEEMAKVPRFEDAHVSIAKGKTSITIDQDVLDWYRKGGRGFQSRVNFALRWFMEEYEREHGEPAQTGRSSTKGGPKRP